MNDRPFKQILLPLDGSDATEALAFARAFGLAGARIELLHVVDQTAVLAAASEVMSAFDPSLLLDELGEQGRSLLKAAQDRCRAAGVEAAVTLVRDTPVAGILEAAATSSADLIIVETHGRRGLPRLVLGSVTEGVLRTGTTPVLTVNAQTRASEHSALRRLLVAVDDSDQADAAAAFAGRLARALGSVLLFCHVIDTAAIRSKAAFYWDDTSSVIEALRSRGCEIIAHARRCAGLPVAATSDNIVEAEPTEGIVDSAVRLGADAIVIGSHGRRGLQRFFLGSVAEEVIRSSPLPVFVIRETVRGKMLE